MSARLIVPSVGEDVEPLELSYTAGGSAQWYKRFGKLFGSTHES